MLHEVPLLSSHSESAVTLRAMCGMPHQLRKKATLDREPIHQPNPTVPAWQLTVPAFLRGLITTKLRKVPSERWQAHSRTPLSPVVNVSQPEFLLSFRERRLFSSVAFQGSWGTQVQICVPFRGHKVLTVMAREPINKLSCHPWLWRMGEKQLF